MPNLSDCFQLVKGTQVDTEQTKEQVKHVLLDHSVRSMDESSEESTEHSKGTIVSVWETSLGIIGLY